MLGDFDLSTIIYGKFTTYRPSSGAPFTLAGTPALSVYKDNSTTQSTAGVTLTVDFDAVTGMNHFAIDTSSDGTFYSAGSFFDIVITTGTVDSISAVGSVVEKFTIRKNSSLKPTVPGTTFDVNSVADGVLKRDMSLVTGEASRSLLNAIRFIRNKFTVVGATLTVYKEDDVTTAWTGAVTSDASAAPITGNDPA